MACETCRIKKIKCDQARPKCSRCEQRSITCNYVSERQLSRKLDNTEIANRLYRMESFLQTIQNDQISTPNERNLEGVAVSDAATQAVNETISSGHSSRQGNLNRELEDAGQTRPTKPLTSVVEAETTKSSCQLRQKSQRPRYQVNFLDQILWGQDAVSLPQNHAAIWFKAPDGDEYLGPSSGISLLSDVGLEWIETHIDGAHDICVLLKSAVVDAVKHLQMPKCFPCNPFISETEKSPLKPLPSIQVTWEYVNAYFKDAQCLFPILDRPVFERRLSVHFQEPAKCDAWSALLNAVLAAGCRAMLSAETAVAFGRSSQESWGYFQNAIELVGSLVYKPANVMTVQALTVMTVYTQGLSSPERLENTLCCTAAQVAQALGMHKQPLPNLGLTDYETQERNRLFWVVYILDKTIALRTGRPSVIDDDEINCLFPQSMAPIVEDSWRETSPSGGGDVELRSFNFFLTFARFARLCGRIAKQLYSSLGLSFCSQDLLSTAEELTDELAQWCKSIPLAFRPGTVFRPSSLPNNFPVTQALILHFGYNDAICAIYRRFNAMFLQHELQTSPKDLQSTLIMADTKCLEAARSMILLTKHLEIESHAPGWLLHYYPVTALIAVFTHVVCNPLSESVNNEIALMEVVVGHFGRLEFITSGGVPFNKVGELVRLARLVVHNARRESSLGDSLQHPPTLLRDSTRNDGYFLSSHSVAQSNCNQAILSQNNTRDQLGQRIDLSEARHDSAPSSAMSIAPQQNPQEDHQRGMPIDSFIDSATSDVDHTAASFLSDGMGSTDDYLMDQDSLSWQMDEFFFTRSLEQPSFGNINASVLVGNGIS